MPSGLALHGVVHKLGGGERKNVKFAGTAVE
jgi:hypothetical protein